MSLQLRLYEVNDEHDARAAHESLLLDDFHFLLGFNPLTTSWAEFLESNERQLQGLDPSEYRVRGVQLAAVVDGVLVGRASLRFELNDFFALRGGHVGYGVIPSERQKGYATEILRQSLIALSSEGIERVLVTCTDHNIASARVIERCGGVLESILPSDDGEFAIRRYWID
jgi:predicted acetyltransferase